MYVTVRASGACARSVASSPSDRSRLRPSGRRLAGIRAAAYQRERVGEEQRGAEREHQLAQDLVVEAHRREPYRRALRQPRGGTPAEAALQRLHGPPAGVRLHRSGDPLVDGRPTGARTCWSQRDSRRPRGTISVSVPRSGRSPRPVLRTRKQRARIPAIVTAGRRRTSYAPAATATRSTSDAGSAPAASPKRGTRPLVHEIAVVAAVRRARPSSHVPDTSTCNAVIARLAHRLAQHAPAGERARELVASPTSSRAHRLASARRARARPPDPVRPRRRAARPHARAAVHSTTTAASENPPAAMRRSNAPSAEPTQSSRASHRDQPTAARSERRTASDATCETAPMRLLVARCSVTYEGRLGARLAPGVRLVLLQGRRLDRDPLRRQGVQAAQLDEPAVRDRRTATASIVATQPEGRDARDHAARGAARHRRSSSATIPASRRTASRPSCNSCSRRASPRSATTSCSCAASSRPTSARSTCSAATATGRAVVVEVKRVGEIAGVDQLLRYQERLDRDPQFAPTAGMFVAQQIKPQAASTRRARASPASRSISRACAATSIPTSSCSERDSTGARRPAPASAPTGPASSPRSARSSPTPAATSSRPISTPTPRPGCSCSASSSTSTRRATSSRDGVRADRRALRDGLVAPRPRGRGRASRCSRRARATASPICSCASRSARFPARSCSSRRITTRTRELVERFDMPFHHLPVAATAEHAPRRSTRSARCSTSTAPDVVVLARYMRMLPRVARRARGNSG